MMHKYLKAIALFAAPLVAGCVTDTPTPAPVTPPTQFVFPVGSRETVTTVTEPIPMGPKLEFIVPIQESDATRTLELIDIKVRATNVNRTTLATAQLRRDRKDKGTITFKGKVNRVIQKGQVKVHVTTPDGVKLVEYDAKYE